MLRADTQTAPQQNRPAVSQQWKTIASGICELWPGRYNRTLAEALGVPRATTRSWLSRTTAMKDRKEMVQNLGFYAIDGGLVMDGKSTCTSIRIECSKEACAFRTATATTNAFMGQPQVIGVMMSDYKVTKWTKDTISAEMHTPVGGTSYLHIAINDGAPDEAAVINITKSLIAKPGEWITEVLTVANDPAFEKLSHRTER